MAKIIKPDLRLAQDVFIKSGKTIKLDDSQHTLLDPPRKPNKKQIPK